MPILAVYSQAINTRPLVGANLNVERQSGAYLWPTYLIMYFKLQLTPIYSVLSQNSFFVRRTTKHPSHTAESIDGSRRCP